MVGVRGCLRALGLAPPRGFARFYSSSPALRPVKLSYLLALPGSAASARPHPPYDPKRPPLIILHGLFGSKQNWKSLCAAFAQTLNVPVYAVDLRNHGESPHSDHHDYTSMGLDVAEFIKDAGASEGCSIVGHSMGGRVAMFTALSHFPGVNIQRVVAVDISPASFSYFPAQTYVDYVETMKRIDAMGVKSRTQADQVLSKVVPELGVRQFLLTNLVPNPNSPDKSMRFRINLPVLGPSIRTTIPEVISKIPDPEAKYYKPSLFLAGSKSQYVQPAEKHLPVILGLFPSAELQFVDGAGHWVHADKPKETVDAVADFFKRHPIT